MFVCVLILSILYDGVATLPGFGGIIPEGLPNPADFIPDAISNPLNMIFQNKCIEDVGCFYSGPPFYDHILRPLSTTPTSDLNTKFYLYTPTNRKDRQEILPNMESIRNSSFNPNLPIKVLIHGFLCKLDEKDIRYDIRDALLNVNDFNIILVDWTSHNQFPYHQAVANARAVGVQLANLLNFLINNFDVQATNIHIIGHSLGAQMAGWAGEKIPNLGRITGLDPAGPYFNQSPKEICLDTTDADFVDIIHTDGGDNMASGLGVGEAIGHMDFFPNGGRRQPGCTYTAKKDTPGGAVVNVTTDWIWFMNECDHGRANYYFLESINNSDCRFMATLCNSYDDFEKDDCVPQSSTVAEMGFRAKRIPGVPMKSKFFLRTNSGSPFCIKNI